MALTSLLVCPEAHSVQVLSRILHDMDITVEACGDLRMAQARINDRHFDALLVDCQNEAAAVALIAHARKTAANNTTVVIALVSGLNDVREVFAKGANFVLHKPISRERAGHSMRAARSLMQSERRIRTRIPVQANTSIAYAGKEDVQAALIDLSEEGIAFQSDTKLPPNCKVYFQFALPGNGSVIRLSGEVMWQDSSGRVGIRFARVPQTSRRALNDWLKVNTASPAEAAPKASDCCRPRLPIAATFRATPAAWEPNSTAPTLRPQLAAPWSTSAPAVATLRPQKLFPAEPRSRLWCARKISDLHFTGKCKARIVALAWE